MMADVQETTDLGAKRMRRIARVLAVMWAGWWTLVLLLVFLVYHGLSHMSDPGPAPTPSPLWWLMLGLLVSVACFHVAIAWRSEALGGAVLTVEGLLLAVMWLPLLLREPGWLSDWHNALVLGVPTLLSLAAGILFLVSWWKSRPPTSSPATE